MPDSCVNTASPTMLLPAATGRPEACATSCEMRGSAGRVDAAVQRMQVPCGHHHLFQRGVAGALAQAVDGGAGMCGAGTHAASVLAVASPRSLWACISMPMSSALRSCGDASVRAEGLQQAQRVGIAHAHRARAVRAAPPAIRKPGSARDASSKPTLTWPAASPARSTKRHERGQHPGAVALQACARSGCRRRSPTGARCRRRSAARPPGRSRPCAPKPSCARAAPTTVIARISSTSCAPSPGCRLPSRARRLRRARTRWRASRRR
jgi:hypothetical protein